MKIINFAVHHSGGVQNNSFAFTQKQTLSQLNEAHRQRWPDFKSSLGYFIGYNAVIFPDGKLVQTRKIGEETAAVLGHNKDTFSVMLPGNFGLGEKGWLLEAPTPEQVEVLKRIEERALDGTLGEIFQIVPGTEIDIKFPNIGPHRQFGNTECYGESLSDEWARELVRPHFEKKEGLMAIIISLYAQILDVLMRKKKQLGGVRPISCLDDARG